MTGDHDLPVDPWVLLPSVEITATVLTAPVPEIAPAALREFLVARHGPDGRLEDWRIDAEEAVLEERSLAPYWEWRQQWCRTWPMGPQENLDALTGYADQLDHIIDEPLAGLLRRLISMEDGEELLSVLRPSVVEALLSQLDQLRGRLVASRLDGIGVIDDTPSGTPRIGLARSWPPPLTERTLSADRSTALILRPDDGLVLMYGGPHYVAVPHVVAVDLRPDPVIVTTQDGAAVTLAPAEARPLSWVVPNSVCWHLRSVPLVTVWSGLFAGLPEAIDVARRVGSAVTFSVEPPITVSEH